MNEDETNIPESAIETLARSFYKESTGYGFKQVDYLRFVNNLLDIAMQKKPDGSPKADNIIETLYTGLENEIVKFPLCGKRMFIRKPAPLDDKKLWEKWLSDEEGRHFLLSRITAQSLSIDQILYDDKNITGMITLPDGLTIGAVTFLDFDARQLKAELRKIIGEPQYRGQGYAKEATILWLKYGIVTLGLKKIYLNTLDTNIRNIHMNEELGFKVEGIMRSEVLIDDEYRDVLRMGLRIE
ncbi:MAG TPA: GNAT family N-acetyltransferase [bacterium]|nr:GNAT family N-acetyltransferase [bacterium]HPN44112.1 GNAT family N-acetyltransferase [bacterium]